MKPFAELSVFNSITFIESSHSYLVNGNSTRCPSVTQLIKRFKKPFEKEKMAKLVAKKTGLPVEQIKEEWDQNNLYSTTLGSMLHKYIENFYNCKKIPFEGDFKRLRNDQKDKIFETLPKLIHQFHDFAAQHNFLHSIKNEFVVGDIRDTNICGMLDMLCYNSETDGYEILDFKTNKKMSKTSKYGKLLYPFDDMSEGEVNEYTIQLNVYKYIIEKYTSLRVNKMKIIWFNVANQSYELFELEHIQDKIAKMFECFKK